MSTRVTVLQALKLALTALIIGLVPNPLHAGDKAYIEIEIDGEMLGKWMEFCNHWEYNPDGKEIYHKRADSDDGITETWYKYDRNGKRIHTKYSSGNEWWYECDLNGNEIHEKSSFGLEYWHEYDRNGNKIHEKRPYGEECWYEYDRNGNRIHTKYSNGREWQYEYDRHGNMIRNIEKYKDGKCKITVYILEYYTDSTTVKTKTEYRYEQWND